VEIVDFQAFGRQKVMEWLLQDPIGNLFAVYDITRDPGNTSLHLAVEGRSIRGYLLQYGGLSYPAAIVRGEEAAGFALLDLLRGQKLVLFADTHLSNLVKQELEVEAVLEEDLMSVERSSARLSASGARRLTTEDAPKVAGLYSAFREEGESPQSYAEWLGKHVVYGAFSGSRLVSVGGTWAETDGCWMLGGIYTSPDMRNRGLATTVTSAITRDSLERTGKAALYVVSGNDPAIRVYEGIGYAKVGRRIWLDIGTGVKPLTSQSS